jgi:oxygen-dependent protoporphyrinogen oxidase
MAASLDAPAGRPRVAIVGGGLTGLTAAWRLQLAGIAVRVFERGDAVGGRTRSIRRDGFIFDVGAITMLPTYTAICALIDELGIGGHLHRVVPVIGIPRAGRIHRLDLAHPLKSLLSTQLISTRTKLRMMKLVAPLVRTWRLSTYETLSTLAAYDGESIADFARRKCGDEFHEFIAGPIISGNTLNSTESAPAGELLWMLRQYAAPFLLAFDQGINFLAESLGARVPVQFGSDVTAVDMQSDRVAVRIKTAAGTRVESFEGCVIALPPKQLLQLRSGLTESQCAFLSGVEPLCSVNLHVGLKRTPAATETFILPPRSEQAHLTTIVMDHLKAPGRAPAGKGVVSFFLSDSWCREHFDRPDPDILRTVLPMAAPFIGDLSADVESYVVQRWPYAIIRSRLGLYRSMRSYEADLDGESRVQIGGDFLSMGMEAAVNSGTRVAARLQRVLAGRSRVVTMKISGAQASLRSGGPHAR